jgi:hypothetical protein
MAPHDERRGAPVTYPITSARPRRLVSMRDAMEAVGRAAIGPIPCRVQQDVVLVTLDARVRKTALSPI